MTEIAEPVAVEIALGNDSSCPFCSEKSNNGRKNDFSNSPSKLGTSLGSEPEWVIETTHPMSGEMRLPNRLRTNAHHVIPADASFNPHPKIKLYLEKGADISDNVGYGVNHKNNGIWLPSYPEDFQATNVKAVPIPWGEMTSDFRGRQVDITRDIMWKTRRQFHDAHPAYSNFVKGLLDKLCERVEQVGAQHTCSGATTKPKPWDPPYSLTGRLDGISRRLSGYLVFPFQKWKAPLFTSDFARTFRDHQLALQAKYLSS